MEETDTKELTLLSRNQVFYSSMKFEDCVDWSDMDNLSPMVLSSFVTHEDPVIQQAAGRIAKWVGGANALGSDEEAVKYMKAVYAFMGENIAYQTPPVGETGKQFIQHVKYGRDVLKNKAGTCIDLAILYGSLCQAVGLEPVLYKVPGHCFPAVKLPQSGRIVPVESTLIGRAPFLDANVNAMEKQFKLMDTGEKPFTKVEIAAMQKQGAFPIDLPNVGEDPLDKWGIKMPTVTANDPLPPKMQDTQEPTAVEKAIVGTWKTSFLANGKRFSQMTEFTSKGTYSGVTLITTPQGTTSSADSGTYTVTKNALTIHSRVLGVTLVRKLELKGEEFQVELQEVGQTVIFKRVK
jgi:hypothetical protein